MKKQQFTRSAIALACVTSAFFAGNAYAATSTLQKNADGTTYDTATGLTWKRCMEGQTWDGTTCTGTAANYTFDAANALTGKVTFAGQSDWRMPNIRELLTIGDAVSVYAPPVWSGSPKANDANNAWFTYYGADSNSHPNSDKLTVRLVRGGLSSALLNLARPDADYTDNGDGTVTHKPTNLTWQRCMVGQTWDGTTCTGFRQIMTWDKANTLTSSVAGKTDWRLPSKQELESLVDYTKTTAPMLNNIIFPNTSLTTAAWSGSPSASSSGFMQVVNFVDGSSYLLMGMLDSSNLNGITYGIGVRLVRGGQSSAPATLSDTDCFFDWAEARLPNLLTPHQTTQTAGTISYRGAYTSGMYIGVTGDSVLALGGSFGNTATTIGTLSSFLPTARAASCK